MSTSTEVIDNDGKVDPGESDKLVAVEADGERYDNPNACDGEGEPGGSVTTTAQGE